ncbi:hypothetical protein ACF044_15965 [Microbacterium sp. NPDC016588]
MPQQPDAPDEHEDVPPEETKAPDGVSPRDDTPEPERGAQPDAPDAAPAPPSARAQQEWPPPAAGPAHPGGPAATDDGVVPAPPRDTAPPEEPGAPAGSGAPAAPPAAGRGPGVGVGVGLGCVAHVIAFPLMLITLMSAAGIWGALWPFYVIGLAAIVGMFSEASRKVSTGVLIVSAAAWIVFLGPCVALVGG